jgi:hypothetical protein
MSTVINDSLGQWLTVAVIALGALLAYGNCRAVEPAGETQGFDGLSIIENTNLDTLRGGNGDTTITVSNTQNLQASIQGSEFSVGTINSGGVSFGQDAIGNFSGIGLFNIVTGNNNAVDTAIGVTFNLQ